MTTPAATIRVATFNISCSRPTAGGLLAALQAEEAALRRCAAIFVTYQPI